MLSERGKKYVHCWKRVGLQTRLLARHKDWMREFGDGRLIEKPGDESNRKEGGIRFAFE